jgi:hypothetical protein
MAGIKHESDPNGLKANEPGAKLDAGKSPLYQGLINYFPRACMAVADLSGKGAKKYSWGGWADAKDGILRYTNAMCRHLFKEPIEGRFYTEDGEDYDHAVQTAWNAFARLELMLREDEKNRKQRLDRGWPCGEANTRTE